MSWETELALEFKARNNPQKIGVVIGTVTSAEPFKASILDGQVVLDDSNTYICRHLLQHEREFTMTGTQGITGEIQTTSSITGSGTGSINGSAAISGSGSVCPESGSVSVSGTGNVDGSLNLSINGTTSGTGTITGENTGEGTITIKPTIKAGDMVLVIPSGDEQSFFIVDVLEGVK